MADFVKNASPQNINYGANDKSAKLLPPQPEKRSQHVPKYFVFAPKGPIDPMPIEGANTLFQLYGEEGFDSLSPFFNHASRHMMTILGQANTCVVQRVIPEDVKGRSNMTIYIDVLPCKVPNYIRKGDGSLSIDPDTEEPKIDANKPTIPGYKIKFIKEYYEGVDADLGKRVSKPGTMIGEALTEEEFKTIFVNGNEYYAKNIGDDNKVYSTMYPLFEFKSAHYGSYYNNIGLSFDLIPYDDQNPQWLKDNKALTYYMTLYTRADETSSPTVVKSVMSEPRVQFMFKKNAVDTVTKNILDFVTRLEQNYSNTTNTNMELRYLDYETPYIYYKHLDYVLKLFVQSEAPYITDKIQVFDDGIPATTASWFDFTTTNTDQLLEYETYLFNIFNGKSSKGVQYFTVHMSDLPSNLKDEDHQQVLSVTESIPMYMSGGDDGTLDDTHYEKEVVKYLSEYLDKDSPVQNTATNVETILYDSGFTPATKLRLFDFIAVRKNTIVVACTQSHDLGEKYISLSDSRALASALVTRARLYPESTYFGTETCRAVVLMQSGLDKSGTSRDRLPMSFDLGVKAARMMGATNGIWNTTKRFDGKPNNIITELYDIQPKFIPASIKPLLWDIGVVWVEPADMYSYMYPAIKSVYQNDTSVLNSFYAIVAVATCATVSDDVWRNFTGSVPADRDVFIADVINFANKSLNGKFGGIIEAVPDAFYSELDEIKGYSWQLVINLGGNPMLTQQQYRTDVYRMAEMPNEASRDETD